MASQTLLTETANSREDRQYLDDLARDERFIDNASRIQNRDELAALLEAKTKQQTRAQLLDKIKDGEDKHAGLVMQYEKLQSSKRESERKYEILNEMKDGLRTELKAETDERRKLQVEVNTLNTEKRHTKNEMLQLETRLSLAKADATRFEKMALSLGMPPMPKSTRITVPKITVVESEKVETDDEED